MKNDGNAPRESGVRFFRLESLESHYSLERRWRATSALKKKSEREKNRQREQSGVHSLMFASLKRGPLSLVFPFDLRSKSPGGPGFQDSKIRVFARRNQSSHLERVSDFNISPQLFIRIANERQARALSD